MVAGDLEGVVRLAQGLAGAPQWARSVYEGFFKDGAGLVRLALVAVVGEGGRAGFVGAGGVWPEVELESIAVGSAWQRQGVARALLAELLGRLAERRYEQINLEVRASNAAARGLYEAVGFLVVGRREGYYADPVEDAVVMMRPILGRDGAE